MNEMPTKLSDVRASIEKAKWLESLGKPLDDPFRLENIEDWPGPEDPSVMPLGEWQQELFDSLSDSKSATELFHEIREAVSQLARVKVPFDPNGDVWEWPNFAVAVASWTAGLVAMHAAHEKVLPADLATQWSWFLEGRLPCAYAVSDPEAKALFEQFYSNGPPPEGYVNYFEQHPNQFVVY